MLCFAFSSTLYYRLYSVQEFYDYCYYSRFRHLMASHSMGTRSRSSVSSAPEDSERRYWEARLDRYGMNEDDASSGQPGAALARADDARSTRGT